MIVIIRFGSNAFETKIFLMYIARRRSQYLIYMSSLMNPFPKSFHSNIHSITFYFIVVKTCVTFKMSFCVLGVKNLDTQTNKNNKLFLNGIYFKSYISIAQRDGYLSYHTLKRCQGKYLFINIYEFLVRVQSLHLVLYICIVVGIYSQIFLLGL